MGAKLTQDESYFGVSSGRTTDAALRDVVTGLAHWPQWLTLSIIDIRLRFRRSVLGPLWFTLSFAFTIGVLALVYTRVLHEEIGQYLPYLATGLLLWNFVSSTVQEGCDAFISNREILLQTSVPLSTCILRVLCRNSFVLALNSVLIPVVFAVSRTSVGTIAAFAVPGLILMVVNLAWLCLVLAIICTRFRDVTFLVVLLLQLSLLVTPILWRANTPDLQALAVGNPLYHSIELVRAPLLGRAPATLSWIVSMISAAAGWSGAFLLFARSRRRIAFWL